MDHVYVYYVSAVKTAGKYVFENNNIPFVLK